MSVTFASLPRWKRWFEVASLGLTAYSMGVFFAEMEVGGGERSVGWWLWNERVIAVLFTVEYLFRWAVSHDRKGHPARPMAVIDLVSILPFWVGFFVPAEHLGVVRALRVLRILRLYRYTDGFDHVRQAFRRCRSEMEVVVLFLAVVSLFTSVVFYQTEHAAQPDKVARLSDALWWCVVTVATVGYGDITPVTSAGRAVSVFAILAGTACYGVLMTDPVRRGLDRRAAGDAGEEAAGGPAGRGGGLMKRETKSAAIRSLLTKGVTDYDEIIRRLAQKGVHVSRPLICHLKNGKIKGAKKITIPYSPFRKSRHAGTFHQTLRHLQEWVGDDATFRRLLREYDSLVKSGATDFLKRDRQVTCKSEVVGRRSKTRCRRTPA